ncbi:T9SS type B sorting domain-containing protein [Aestuariibaculum suncheonense]|uniref:T9SS type B sorting domain-containing protein n=1 Tax=Aestuariibaculum suncheonense TaxID=1028745 RepID=A0A8J6Q4J2_9FLAO|nr:T9SS type B sorting domain-containing protein [Aestuariibaculum suncheonense]MBD0834908.1 T9SS type B sorting domain-containing protein [Aestuariibaculum suncheonense]
MSKTHFIPPLTNAEFGNANPEDQYIYLSTPNNTDVTYTIKPVGQSVANYITGVVSNNTPREIYLTSGYGQLFIPSSQTSVITNNKGYIIEADDVIYVSVRMNAGGGAQAGALVSKGLSALGTTFRVGTYTNENPQNNYLNFVSVMATEDDTNVNFSNLPSGLVIKNYSGTTPININLNKGESYTIATNSADSSVNRDGLIGTLVTSSKSIVVNCGSTNGSFHNGNSRDYGIDQIVDLSKVGNEYIFVKGAGGNGWENILIVAHSNNTSISINGNSPTATINAGEYYLIEGDYYNSNGNMYVKTSEDVFAFQGIGATNSEANQGMFFVPPLSCEARGNLDNIANINKIGNTAYSGGISIVTKVDATITINNTPINNFSTSGPYAVTGNPNYVTYKVLNLSGNISVQSTDELYCAYFNYNGAATSGSFYSGFPSAPEINFNAEFATLGNCIPNITLAAANTESFDSFEWWFDDGFGAGFTNTNISTPNYTPLIPGKYKLKGIIACSGLTLESIEIPVSFCPDDIDNDGIIDNLDLDNDNDGILNCIESKGDAIIDITNINTPEIKFQDGTSSTSIVSASFSQNNSSGLANNTLTGTSFGNFTSTLQPDIDNENNYSLTFTEPINFKLEETASIPHTVVNGEYYIIKILPSNKNITLVDPDDRLLIDTNFDGIFETGVTQISSTEIHFKINPNPAGNFPYKFVADQITGFNFIHNLTNLNNASSFTANITLTCFKLDTDGDGIYNALDLDSDNDGIPDIIEARATTPPLSNTDNNNDGIDDGLFNTAAGPTDSDADGIPDFYDLDSDNDGIYDLEESGSGLPDSNLDGIIDNVLNTIGTNGWDNNAETSADSNTIGYTLNDTDSDSIFNYTDLDSDGDSCPDVIEAGFTDANNNALLGTIPVVDTKGVVNNALDGYTTPNPDYLIIAPINITTQPIDTIACENTSSTISIASPDSEFYQWELSTDGLNWVTLNDDLIYSGTQTANLTIMPVPLTFNNNQYRVKLDRTGNSCGLYSSSIILSVNAQPIINSTVELIQCDDDDPNTLGFSSFNLTEANIKISNNASNETFSYYLTETSAILGDINSTDYIDTPTAFTNRTINTDQVWARVENSNGCSSITQISLKVSTTAIPASFLATFNQCDDFLDINGNNTINNNNTDGIATFDFSSVANDILNNIPAGQNPLPPRFYRNESDALAEVNEITDISNYRNIGYPYSQYIYVRVDSNISNDCLGLGPHVLLNVEPLPKLNAVSIPRQCDYESTDNVINYPFDTSKIENDLLGNQNPIEFNIIYSDETGKQLPSPLPNPFLTSSQIITIQVSNAKTSAPDGPCYIETSLEFIVDEHPFANPVSNQIFCDDGLDGTFINDGLHSFDTSAFSNIILGNQTNMDIYFSYINQEGISVANATALPNPLISTSQTITVEVINPENTNCVASTNIELIVNPIPDFAINEEEIICTSDPTFTTTLVPVQTNASEIFNYSWSLEGGSEISNNKTLNVSFPGNYTITLTNPTTLCSTTKTVSVRASELANITNDNITVVDISEHNSVTINNPESLGSGTYLFALESKDKTVIFPYQDSPNFNNVRAGEYTLFVKDDICGTAEIDVFVIGYRKFFTPNGDGENDYWKIQGLNNTQAKSTIYIYNRYGKLLKQLNPLEEGWDGTSNGTPLPTDDYWFKVLLVDGRNFMGHFALKR